MGPRQLSQQCRDFFIIAIRIVKLPHAEQVSPRKSPQTGLGAGNVGGKLFHYTITPFSVFDLSADICSHLPIKLDQGGVNRLKCLLACGVDQSDYLYKCCFNLIVFCRFFQEFTPLSH